MARTIRVLAAALALAATLAPPASGQGAPADAAGVTAELARLNATLAHVAELLDGLARRQDTSLLLERVAVAAQGLTALEEQARRAAAERDGLENEQYQLALRLEQLEEIQPDNDGMRGQVEMESRQMRGQLPLLKARLATAEQRVAELEGRVAEQRATIAGWQQVVDRRLSAVR